jgi:hypothetical protein
MEQYESICGAIDRKKETGDKNLASNLTNASHYCEAAKAASTKACCSAFSGQRSRKRGRTKSTAKDKGSQSAIERTMGGN